MQLPVGLLAFHNSGGSATMKRMNNLFTLEPKSTIGLSIPLLRKAVCRCVQPYRSS